MSSSFAYSNSNQSQRHGNSHPRAPLYPSSHNPNHYNPMSNYQPQNRPPGATSYYGESRGPVPRHYRGNTMHSQHAPRGAYHSYGNGSMPYVYSQASSGYVPGVPLSNHPSAHMWPSSISNYQQHGKTASEHQVNTSNQIQSAPMQPSNPSLHIQCSNYSGSAANNLVEVVHHENPSSTEASQQTIASVVQNRLIQHSEAWAEVNEIAIPLSPLPAIEHVEKVLIKAPTQSSYALRNEHHKSNMDEKSHFSHFENVSCTTLLGTDISIAYEENFIPGIDSTPPDGFKYSRGKPESPNPLESSSVCTVPHEPVNSATAGHVSMRQSVVADISASGEGAQVSSISSVEIAQPVAKIDQVQMDPSKPSHTPNNRCTSYSPTKVFSELPVNHSDTVLFSNSSLHKSDKSHNKHDSSASLQDDEKSFGLKYWFMKATVPNSATSNGAAELCETENHVLQEEQSSKDATTPTKHISKLTKLKQGKSKRRPHEAETCPVTEYSDIEATTTSKRKRSHRIPVDVDCSTISTKNHQSLTQFTSISLGDLRSSLKQIAENIRNTYTKEILESDLSEVKQHYDDARSELHRLVNQRIVDVIPQQCMTCSVLCVRYAITQDLHMRHANGNLTRTSDISSMFSLEKQKQPFQPLSSSSQPIQSSKGNAFMSCFSVASSPANNSSGSSVAFIYAKCENQLRDIAREFDKAMRTVIAKASRIESKRLDIVRQMGILGIIAARATLGMDLYHAWIATNSEEFQIPVPPAKKPSSGNRTGTHNSLGFPVPLPHGALNITIEYPASNASHETHQESPASTLSFQSGNGSSGGGGPGSIPSGGSSLVGATHLSGSLPSYRVLEYATRSEEIWEFFQQSRRDMLSKNREDTLLMEDELVQYFPWGLDAVNYYRDDSILVLCMLDALTKIVTLRLSY